MKNVLILTHQDDPHSKSVCAYYERIGVTFLQLDTDKVIGNYTVTFDSRNGIYEVSHRDRRVHLDETWNIWNRRVMEPDLPHDFPSELSDIVLTETEKTWEGLLFVHPGRVVNRPQANLSANNKLDQLLFARRYGNGIYIPETLLTNDPEEARRFYRDHPSICHKLQKVAVVEKGGRRLVTYTNLVTDRNMEQIDLIRTHPTLFQEYVDKDYELRVVVIHDRVIGIAIYSQDSEVSKVDFRRYDFEKVRYRRVDLPENVERFCRDLVNHYGLSFGAIDIIKSKDDRYFFLEINPNGQWLWLEEHSGYDLTKDVAEGLLK